MDDRRRELEQLIERRLAILRVTDAIALAVLVGSSDDIEIVGLPGKLNVYRESSGDAQTRIIVQGVRPSPSGISALVIARGFLANQAGYVRDLREDELYEYS
jgi:hypothetical protein